MLGYAKHFVEAGIVSTLLAWGLEFLDSPVKTLAAVVAFVMFAIAGTIVVVHEYRSRKQRQEVAKQLPLPGETHV